MKPDEEDEIMRDGVGVALVALVVLVVVVMVEGGRRMYI